MTNIDSLLPCIEIENAKPADKCIIWLHGLGADGSDFVPFVSELKLPSTMRVRFIFPHAPLMPITINNGYEMRAWHDIPSFNLTHEVDHPGIQKSVSAIDKLIQKEIAQGIPAEHIILGGFSQGAAISLMAGLNLPHPLAGIAALSGYFPATEEILNKINTARKKTPIFIAHGTEDMIVPYALGKAAYMLLKQTGLPCSWHSYSIAHTVCAGEIDDLSHWMQTIWQTTGS